MDTPSVAVTIDKLGRVKLDAQGYTGTACKDATAPVERAFRGAQAITEDKPEAFYTVDGEATGEQPVTL